MKAWEKATAPGTSWRCRVGRFLAFTGICLFFAQAAGCGDGRPHESIVEPQPVGGPLLVRRLTESQYRATVADIFGPDIPVAARFERGIRAEGLQAIGTSESGMSPFGVEQYDAAAQSIADAVLSEGRRDQYMPCIPAAGVAFDAQCAALFFDRYGPRLLRRPMLTGEVDRYVNLAEQGNARLGSFYEGLKFALIGLMVSPEFLLRIENAAPTSENGGPRQLDAYSMATRLSYFLTNSTPDQALLEAAIAGDLATQEGLARQVDRLIASPGFEKAVRAFFEDMLEFELFDDLAKDPLIYPAFNSDVAADAREQMLLTISDHLIKQDGDYRDLFTTRNTYLTRDLGIVYRLPVATRKGWEPAVFPEGGGRQGIHTDIGFLALHSHPGRSSPTLRGKAVREVFLCQEVPDPPANVNFSVVQDPSSTNMPTARDRLDAHRTEPSCAGCHKIMDPLGLTLENFDGLGAYRTRENGAVIDASGSLDGTEFDTPQGLAQALHDHPETPRCLVEKMYRFAVGRDTVWDERAYMDYLIETFRTNGYRVPALMRTIALSKNFFVISAEGTPRDEFTSTGLQAQEGGRS